MQQEFVEDNLEQFMYSTTKNTKMTQKEKVEKKPIVKTKQIPKDLNTIQEMNFKYIWNFLKQHQDSEYVTAIDLGKAVQAVMKKPIDEEILKEMININNNEGISFEELREIFIECKLKM